MKKLNDKTIYTFLISLETIQLKAAGYISHSYCLLISILPIVVVA